MGHNLLMRHPPFQIDANLGYPAAVAEMLMQSHNGCLQLLPALPEDWETGSFSGFSARGNFRVEAAWEDHRLSTASIAAGADGMLTIRESAIKEAATSRDGIPVPMERLSDDCFCMFMKAGQTLTIEVSGSSYR